MVQAVTRAMGVGGGQQWMSVMGDAPGEPACVESRDGQRWGLSAGPALLTPRQDAILAFGGIMG